MKFYGRTEPLEAVRRELRLSDKSSRLVVVQGRRGVGKTTLMLKVAKESGRPCSTSWARGSTPRQSWLRYGWIRSGKSLVSMRTTARAA